VGLAQSSCSLSFLLVLLEQLDGPYTIPNVMFTKIGHPVLLLTQLFNYLKKLNSNNAVLQKPQAFRLQNLPKFTLNY
jgi:hypothetical protein